MSHQSSELMCESLLPERKCCQSCRTRTGTGAGRQTPGRAAVLNVSGRMGRTGRTTHLVAVSSFLLSSCAPQRPNPAGEQRRAKALWMSPQCTAQERSSKLTRSKGTAQRRGSDLAVHHFLRLKEMPLQLRAGLVSYKDGKGR